jgi:hypothetical protein
VRFGAWLILEIVLGIEKVLVRCVGNWQPNRGCWCQIQDKAFEVRVFQCLRWRNSLLWIESHHFHHQVNRVF